MLIVIGIEHFGRVLPVLQTHFSFLRIGCILVGCVDLQYFVDLILVLEEILNNIVIKFASLKLHLDAISVFWHGVCHTPVILV